jgi:hypothetical protein
LLAWRDAKDGRVRGTLRYHGAGTGRWTGHGPQPQNFRRDSDGVEAKITAVSTGDLRHVAELYPPLEVIGDLARAMICAAPERRLSMAIFPELKAAYWLGFPDSNRSSSNGQNSTAPATRKTSPTTLLAANAGSPKKPPGRLARRPI